MTSEKIQQLFTKILNKQKDAFKDLSQNFHDLQQKTKEKDHNNNLKIDFLTRKKQINQEIAQNNHSTTKNRSNNQSQVCSRGTPINGFKYTNQGSLSQEQQDLPRPSRRMKCVDQNVGEDNFDISKNISKVNYSIIPNKQQNPQQYQQIGHLRHVCDVCSEKPKKKSIKSQKKNHNIPIGMQNRPIKHRNYFPIEKKSVRTQNLLIHEHQQKVKDISDLSKQFSRTKQKKVNIKLNSNVVSYCQSLKQSSVDVMTKVNGSVELQTNPQKELKKPGHIRLKKMRYHTQQRQKIKKQIQNQFQQIRQKHQDIKQQLKVFYDKKKKIQQKLKKLNTQMAQINGSQVFNYQSLNSKNSYMIQRGKERQLFAGQIINIGRLKLNRSKQQKHQKQLEKSRKAIQFVQKVSKQSLRRRIEHQKKIKKDIYNRVKEHACVDCSRMRCHIEVIEGQTRKQTQIIPTISLDKSRIK